MTDIELDGFEDGYYNQPKKQPPLGAVGAYMTNYWLGQAARFAEDARFDALCVKWDAEDRRLQALQA